jgi:hypothetical protein
MEYSNQQPSESYYYPPTLQQQQQQQHHSHQYAPTANLSPPPTPVTAVPFMSVPGSYPSSQGSGSYDTAQMHPHRTGEASSSRGTASPGESRSGPNGNGNGRGVKRIGGKANVSSACGPCKKAHLACDVQRPCKRCTNMGKEDQCEDVPVCALPTFSSGLQQRLTISTRREVGQK